MRFIVRRCTRRVRSGLIFYRSFPRGDVQEPGNAGRRCEAKQAQAFIDAIRRCFDAGQSGAIGAEPYAFILVFAEAVGVVIDVPFAPPPLAVTMAFGGAGRRVVVLIQNIVTEARNVFRDLRALLERLGVVIRLMDVLERQARQREADAEVDVGQAPRME